MGVGGCDGKEIRQIAAQSVKRQGLAGAGAGGWGNTGSADALAPANPNTAAEPAATPPSSTRQLRAILFIRSSFSNGRATRLS